MTLFPAHPVTNVSVRAGKALPMVKFKVILLFCILGQIADASAVTRKVKFLYRPDPSVPASNAFVPVSYVPCGDSLTCRSNEYGVSLGSLQAAPVRAGEASRMTPMFRTTTQWRQVVLTNNSTGGTLLASLRVVALSGRFNFKPRLSEIVPEAGNIGVAYTTLFGGTDTLYGGWIQPPAPCMAWQPRVSGNDNWILFGIRTADTPCMRPVTKDIASLEISNTRVIYEILLPRPQLAQAGVYTGLERYTVGPGMDIDFGDTMLPTDPELAINLELEVDPIFKVEFPGGSNLLSLEPEGGWLNWLNRGRKPTRLWREQAFNFATSVPFKVSMQCEHTSGDHCAIAASDGHQVPVEIRMTLPAGMQDTTGRPVRNYLLSRHDSPQFNPALIILGPQGKLHFEVPRADMEAMLDHAGKAYNGSVTIIWDPQI